MDEARSTLSKLLVAQEQERKEIEERIAEKARHLHNFQADYQRLVDNSKESEIVTKSAEQVIDTARVTIAKAQALIQVNNQKLVVARKRLEELEAAKKQVQEDLQVGVSSDTAGYEEILIRGRVAGSSLGRS